MSTTNKEQAEQTKVIKEFDVRGYPCMNRHDMVFGAFDELKPGEAFVFTNDHDPRPLSYKLEAVRSEPFRWEYLKAEPGEVTVKVSKVEEIGE